MTGKKCRVSRRLFYQIKRYRFPLLSSSVIQVESAAQLIAWANSTSTSAICGITMPEILQMFSATCTYVASVLAEEICYLATPKSNLTVSYSESPIIARKQALIVYRNEKMNNTANHSAWAH